MSESPEEPEQKRAPPSETVRTLTSADARGLRDCMRHLMLVHGSLDEAQRPCGAPVSAPHAYVLMALLHDGPMTVSSLALGLSIDRTNVSRLCSRMETSGEVVREPHPDNGRARVLRLTRLGLALARSVDASSAVYFAQVLANLGVSADQVVETLSALTTAMHKTIQDRDQEPTP